MVEVASLIILGQVFIPSCILNLPPSQGAVKAQAIGRARAAPVAISMPKQASCPSVFVLFRACPGGSGFGM